MAHAPEPPRILVVDDEADLAFMLAARLRAAGLSVGLFSDAESALAEAFRSPPDAVLLDLALPGVDGLEACRRLKDDPRTREVPVLLMTAWPTRELSERARALGVAEVLIKPFDERALPALLLRLGRPPARRCRP